MDHLVRDQFNKFGFNKDPDALISVQRKGFEPLPEPPPEANRPRLATSLVTELMEMYLEGVSTRKVREIIEALCAQQSDEWISDMRCLDVSELYRWRQAQTGEEMTLTDV